MCPPVCMPVTDSRSRSTPVRLKEMVNVNFSPDQTLITITKQSIQLTNK